MKRFRFSLQTVLDVRERREEQARLAWSAALRAEEAAAEAVAREDERWGSALADLTVLVNRADFDPVLWQIQRAYVSRVREERAAAQAAWREAASAADEARDHLVEASRARAALERLREMEYARYREEAQRREIMAIDELNTFRFRFPPPMAVKARKG